MKGHLSQIAVAFLLVVLASPDVHQDEKYATPVPPETPPMPAEHPFFWGGYMLVDTGVVPK